MFSVGSSFSITHRLQRALPLPLHLIRRARRVAVARQRVVRHGVVAVVSGRGFAWCLSVWHRSGASELGENAVLLELLAYS